MNSSGYFLCGGWTVQLSWKTSGIATSRQVLRSSTMQTEKSINSYQQRPQKSMQRQEVLDGLSDFLWDSSGRWGDSDSSVSRLDHSRYSGTSQNEQKQRNKNFSKICNQKWFRKSYPYIPSFFFKSFLLIADLSKICQLSSEECYQYFLQE